MVVSETAIDRIFARIGRRGVRNFLDFGFPERLCSCLDCECWTVITDIRVCVFCARGEHANVIVRMFRNG